MKILKNHDFLKILSHQKVFCGTAEASGAPAHVRGQLLEASYVGPEALKRL